MTDTIVETCELTKRYGDFTALDGLSIALGRGRILGFIGPNGAGKTTTIKILVGQARPTSGWARIAGVDCMREANAVKRLVGYMPDVFGSYDNLRVWEYLDFFGAAYDIPRKLRTERVDEVMRLAGALDWRDRYVEGLSHGMKQRVGIARTMLHDPEVIILDEPANGLDPQARIEMRELLLHLAALGKTLIVTSHILPELSRICDHVAIMTRGRLRAFGTLDEILQRIGQRRTIEVLVVSTDEVERTVSILSELIAERETVAGSTAERCVRFQTSKSDQELADLLAALVRSDVAVSQLREVPVDLEETFLAIARQTDLKPATVS